VAAGGEIDVLDGADYGPITIIKALSIVNDGGGTASIRQSVAGQNAITIKTNAGDVVHLRGLSIDGNGVSADGIQFFSPGYLAVVNCVVRHFSVGIAIGGDVVNKSLIENTIVSDNAGSAITIATNNGNVSGVISRTQMSNNTQNGLGIFGPGGGHGVITLNVVDSSAVHNGGIGYNITNGTGGVFVVLQGVTASQNGSNGVLGANSVIKLAQSVITFNNAPGVFVGNATVYSYGDNDIDTISGGSLTPAIPPKQ
jgi:hypothetical protein